MSAGGAFGGARGLQARAPEKGIFPLDHFGECGQVKDTYLACLKEVKGAAEKCEGLTQAYLQCRMDRNLMAKQDMHELGLGKRKPPGAQKDASAEERKKAGFVAGVPNRA